MNLLFQKIRNFNSNNTLVIFFVILLMLQGNLLSAQLPQCNKVYLDDMAPTLTGQTNLLHIYGYDPLLPASATNPALNTIPMPAGSARGLAISEVLGSGNNVQTFYTIVFGQYWYYDPVTAAWVNTGHYGLAPWLGNGGNIGAGGGFIYNLDPGFGDVYKYDGTGDGVYLMTIPNWVTPNGSKATFDLIADCDGNFYVIRISDNTFLRKYDPSGALLQTWTINNTNGYFLSAGFAIIGDKIYLDHTPVDPITGASIGFQGIVAGNISTTSLNLITNTGPLPQYTNNFVGDLATCGESISNAFSIITIAASATNVIAGTTVTFTSTTTNLGTTPNYQWYVNGIAVAGETNSTFSYMPLNGDVITCKFTSTSICILFEEVESNPITINVESYCPTPALNYSSDFFCQGLSLTALPVFTPAGGVLTISPAGAAFNVNTGSVDIDASDPGAYTITYTLSLPDCPVKTATDFIKVVEKPEANIKVSNNKALFCETDTIMLSTTYNAGYSYQWSPKQYFPEGSNRSSIVLHTVKSDNIYLHVFNDGCGNTDSAQLKVEPCCVVNLPNAFSPNHDGLNDEFNIISKGTQSIGQFSIYNRFGERVFFSTSQTAGWNGYYNDKPCDPGAYYYYLVYTCSDGELYTRKGDVTLLR